MGTKGIAEPLKGKISGENEWSFTGQAGSAYLAEQKAFLESIRAGQPLNCGDYMARSTMVAIMGQLSCYSGKQVGWDEVNESDFYFAPRPEDCTWEMDPPTAPDEKGRYPVYATPGVTKTV
jgi:hypothetical protein